jgi:fatty acid-binding protein DegV
VARLEEIVAADASSRPGGQARLAVHHFGNAAEAEQLASRLAVLLPDCPPAQASALPAVLAAHAGLGVLAVVVGENSTPLGDALACGRHAGGTGGTQAGGTAGA